MKKTGQLVFTRNQESVPVELGSLFGMMIYEIFINYMTEILSLRLEITVRTLVSLGLLVKSVNFKVYKSVVRRLHAIFRSKVAGSPGGGVIVLFWKNTMDAVRSVVSTNDVILNRSCRDMEVGASYNEKMMMKISSVEKKFWNEEEVENYKGKFIVYLLYSSFRSIVQVVIASFGKKKCYFEAQTREEVVSDLSFTLSTIVYGTSIACACERRSYQLNNRVWYVYCLYKITAFAS
uniref:Uncharacterized protein n=1 Tax=Cucumis melo TaxID=3656 RepID=A0A9I9EG17_CUCME